MPGRLFLTRAMSEVADWLGDGPVPQDPPRNNIAPGQDVIVRTRQGIDHARWGMIPVGRVNARGRPVMETIVNARAETLFEKSAFDGVSRAVVPADGWYEWTGEKRRKTPWRIMRKDGGLMGFAAICDVWTAPGGAQLLQAATVTCAPNADVIDIHHRMGVILDRSQIDIWLNASDTDAAAILQPLADGTLTVHRASDVDWSAA